MVATDLQREVLAQVEADPGLDLAAVGIAEGVFDVAALRVEHPGRSLSFGDRAAAGDPLRVEARLLASTQIGRSRIVEAGIALTVPAQQGQPVALVAEFGPPCVAAHVLAAGGQRVESVDVAADRIDRAAGARRFPAQPGALAEPHGGVDAAQLERSQRVLVLDVAAADLETVGQLVLAVGAVDPEVLAALLHLVGDPHRHRVQSLVDRGHRSGEQDAAAERLEAVVGETRHLPHRDDARGRVAVAHDQFDPLAAEDRVAAVTDRVRAGQAAAGELFHHLAQVVVGGEHVQRAARVLQVAAHAGHRSVVLAQVTDLGASDVALAHELAEAVAGHDIAVHQVVAILVQAQVQARVAARLEAGDRRVAVHRVPALRIEVAEQAVAVGLVAVVGHGQQRVALDLALEEEGGAQRGGALAVAAGARPAQDPVLEAVVRPRLAQAQRVLAVEGDDALYDAHREHVAQFRHEGDRALGHRAVGGDAHLDLLRLDRCQQPHRGLAVARGHLEARHHLVQITREQAQLVAARTRKLEAAVGGLERHHRPVGYRLPLAIQHGHFQDRRRLAVGRKAISFDGHHDPVHRRRPVPQWIGMDLPALVDLRRHGGRGRQCREHGQRQAGCPHAARK